jgi:hypothetical protein
LKHKKKIKKLSKDLFILKNKLQFQIKFEKEQNKENKFRIKKLNMQIERMSTYISRSALSTLVFKKIKKPFFFLLKFNFLFLSKLSYLTQDYLSSLTLSPLVFTRSFRVVFIFIYFENIINKFFIFFLL